VARAGSKLEVQLSDPCLVRYDAPPGCPWPAPLDRRPNREPKSYGIGAGLSAPLAAVPGSRKPQSLFRADKYSASPASARRNKGQIGANTGFLPFTAVLPARNRQKNNC
jgi:hypothetical protein